VISAIGSPGATCGSRSASRPAAPTWNPSGGRPTSTASAASAAAAAQLVIPDLQARLDHRKQRARRIAVGEGDLQPLAQRQQFEVAVGHARERGQRQGVPVGACGCTPEAGGAGGGAVAAPEVDFVARGQQRRPVELVRAGAPGMPGQEIAVTDGIDAGQEGRPGLAGPGIGLGEPRLRPRHVQVRAGRGLDEGVQVGAAEAAVPVPGGPLRRGIRRGPEVLERGRHLGGHRRRHLQGTAGASQQRKRTRRVPGVAAPDHAWSRRGVCGRG